MSNMKRCLLALLILAVFCSVSFSATTSWTFGTSSNYTYDTTKIDLTGGMVSLVAPTQSFTHSTSTNFTSSVIDATASAAWQTLSWVPKAPYYKELPDSGASESGYSEGNFSMTDCVLLLHLNDDPAVHGSTLTDSSGQSTNAVLFTSDGSTNKSTTGKLNKAIQLDGTNDYVSISPQKAQNKISASAWFKRNGQPVTTGDQWHFVLGPVFTVELGVPDGWQGGVHDGRLRVAVNTENGWYPLYAGTVGQLIDGEWHHLALTYDGATLLAYIDGVKTGEKAATGNIKTAPSFVGRSGASYSNSTIDEVAIWNRALSATEMLNYYKRGAARIKLQARSGLTGDFVGPDGTSSTYYTELSNSTTGLPSLSLTNISNNRYFQYQASFESDSVAYPPTLTSVTIGPTHYTQGDPTINPVAAQQASFNTISSITETATKDGGEIKYALSNDAGSTWLYYNSTTSSWETSGSTYATANTTSEINSNVITFPAGNGQLLFKAFLHSSGTQNVRLTQVSVQTALLTPEVASVSPANSSINVNSSTTVNATFSHTMDQTSVENAFSLKAISTNLSQSTSETVAGTFSWTNVRSMVFTPSTALKNGYTYQAIITTDAKNTGGYYLASTESWTFRVLLDHEESTIYESTDGKAKVELAANALAEDGYVVINRDPIASPTVVDSNTILTANSKAIAEGNPCHYPITSSITEFNAYNSSGTRITSNFAATTTLTLYYTDANDDGFVDGTTPPIKAENLLIYWLDETNKLWIRVPGSTVNTTTKSVSAPAIHFSTYTLMSTPALDLANAYAFPVPFKPSAGHTQITFTNLASECTIRVYTVSGDLVTTLSESSGTGQHSWNVTNADGAALASGVYVYHIKSSGDSKVGKFVVIR